MKYINKIKQLFEQREISFEQGRLMFEAFKDSDKYEKSVFEQIELNKHKREKNIWGILAVWTLLLIFCLGLLIFYVGSGKLGTKTVKALRESDLASIYIAKGDYAEAIDLYEKSINADPDFSSGYSLLVLTNKILFQETGKQEYSEKADKAMDGLLALIVNKNIQKGRGTNGLLFGVIFIVLAISFVKVVSIVIYSILIKNEERVNRAWAQVSVFYLRKLDMIPALIEAVKEYSPHEKEALKTVLIAASQGRDRLKSLGGIALEYSERLKEAIGNNTPIECSLKDVYVFIERFPKLKTDKRYVVIQNEIDEVEKSLYKAIERYNTRVNVYNSTLRSLPFRFIAGKFGFKTKADINIKG